MKKKILALLLALSMTVNYIPMFTIAQGDGTVDPPSQETQETQQPLALDTKQVLTCEAEEHTHGEGCRGELTCQISEAEGHTHDAALCGTEYNQICAQEQCEPHAHTGACLGDPAYTVTCTIPENHTHGDGCYEPVKELKCTLPLEAPHVHGDGCYITACTQDHEHTPECPSAETPALSCDKTVDILHTHDENTCFSPVLELVCTNEEEDHTHGDDCYKEKQDLICEIPENHTHGDPCKTPNILCTTPVTEGHTHNSDCFETVYQCGQEESQGHAHDNSCYEVSCDKTEHTHGAECCITLCAECEEPEGHKEDCSKYQAPAPECTCGAEADETGNVTHGEECELYVEPSLFDKLMALKTAEELYYSLLEVEDAEALTVAEIDTLLAKLEDLPYEDEEAHDEAQRMLLMLKSMHCTCGAGMGEEHGEDCALNEKVEADDLAWEGWIPLTSERNLTTGKYYLTGNLALNDNENVLSISGGQDVVLDLNGYAITYTKVSETVGQRMINVMGGKLTIQDSNPTAKHYGTVQVLNNVAGAGLWVYDPSITESNATANHVLIEGGIITGAKGPWHGGAIYNEGTLIMNGGTIVGCNADYQGEKYLKDYYQNLGWPGPNNTNSYGQNYKREAGAMNRFYAGGGAVYCGGTSSNFTMNNGARIAYCTTAPFTTGAGGGGVTVMDGATFTMNGGKIDHCWSTYAGAVFVDGWDLKKYPSQESVVSGSKRGSYFNFKGGVIESCGANYGGACYFWYFAHGIMKEGATIQNCSAAGKGTSSIGGAVATSICETTFNLEGGNIINNSSEGRGGGIDSIGGTININSGRISGNTAETDGGAIAISEWQSSSSSDDKDKYIGSLNISGGTITDNHAKGNGGAFWVIGPSVMTGGTVSNCTAKNGGLLYIQMPTVKPETPYFHLEGGTIENCKATDNGGAVYIQQGEVVMSGGTISNCTAEQNGGVFYVSTGNMTMSGGSVSSCNAGENGGAYYVTGGNATMNGGTISACTATNGGAAYVTKGKLTMSAGSFLNCNATENGGAFYLAEGDFKMADGQIEGNMAKNGGAAYISGGDFLMESGTMQGNGKLGETEYGGAVYVNQGNVTIGLQNCTQDAPLEAHAGPKHPVVKNNEASFGGGLAVNGGDLTLYCCNVLENTADNAGTGMNIFIQECEFNQYINGAAIGKEEENKADHGIVMVGGNMNILGSNNVNLIKINYHSNYGLDITWDPDAPEDYWLNLPYCPKQWSEDQAVNKLVFVGWGDHLAGSEAHSIRGTHDYYPIGYPLQVKDLKDGAGQVHLYAIWAPVTNRIEYAASFDGKNEVGRKFSGTYAPITENDPIFNGQAVPTSYGFSSTTEEINIPTPSKPGYKFLTWIMYAKHDKISNWNTDAYQVDENGEPILVDDKPVIDENPSDLRALVNKDMGLINRYEWKGYVQQNFGDIVLVAVFEELPATINYQLVNKADSNGCELVGKSHTIGQHSSKYIDPTTGSFVYDDNGDPTYGPEGATVTAQPGRKVVGWFLNEACTEPVPSDWIKDGKLEMTIKPQKGTDGLWDNVTYYALVEYDYGDLVITTENLPADHSYIFTVSAPENGGPLDGSKFNDLVVIIPGNSSRTIKNVPVGTYLVTEQSGWTWRYEVVDDEPTLEEVNGSNTPEDKFSSYTTENQYWLDDNSYRKK